MIKISASELNPKQKLRDVVKEYDYDQRGNYSYLSSLTSTLGFLIMKWQELENTRIEGLYFINLKLEDFKKDELRDLANATDKNKKDKFRKAENIFIGIQHDFLKLYNQHHPT